MFGCPFVDSPMSPCWKGVKWRYSRISDVLVGDRFSILCLGGKAHKKLLLRFLYYPNTTDPEVIVADLAKNNITNFTALSPLCKSVIEDQFGRLCQPLQVMKGKKSPLLHAQNFLTSFHRRHSQSFTYFDNLPHCHCHTVLTLLTNILMQDAYNMTYKAWAIMVLVPLILTTLLVLIAWGGVSF